MKDKNKEKGKIEFKYLSKKCSKCPYCGSGIENYRLPSYNKWVEEVTFACGLRMKSETPTIFKEQGLCKKTDNWIKLKEKRLSELESVKTYIEENVTDARLKREMLDKLPSHYSIVEWWSS